MESKYRLGVGPLWTVVPRLCLGTSKGEAVPHDID